MHAFDKHLWSAREVDPCSGEPKRNARTAPDRYQGTYGRRLWMLGVHGERRPRLTSALADTGNESLIAGRVHESREHVLLAKNTADRERHLLSVSCGR